ncbi:hypothetical protein NE237_031094 [Protea cynaroides]|uniref:TF-B3 domain-containing protein n=1 Tax=Protea cynaroides TaxID=273540 RepID=A0A9Q0L0I7_9MAGN|nr:hypothetical protein NE237_031094 [Protea cynaroides]
MGMRDAQVSNEERNAMVRPRTRVEMADAEKWLLLYYYGNSSSSSSNFINRNGYYYGSSSSSSSNINEVPDDELSLQVQRVYINWETIEKGFLFSKLLNNSDSGKLNRLLIPIRKAEPTTNQVVWSKFWSTSRCYVLTTGWKKFVNEYGLIGFVHEVFFYKIHDQLEVSDDQPLFIDFKEKVHDQQEVSDDQPLFIDFKKEEPPPTNPTSWLFGQNLILHDQLEVSDDQHLFIYLKKKDPQPTRLFGQNLIPHDQLDVSDDQHLFNNFKKKDPPPTRLFGHNLVPHDQLEVSDDQHLFNDFKKKDPTPTRLFGQNLILHDQLEVSDDPLDKMKNSSSHGCGKAAPDYETDHEFRPLSTCLLPKKTRRMLNTLAPVILTSSSLLSVFLLQGAPELLRIQENRLTQPRNYMHGRNECPRRRRWL